MKTGAWIACTALVLASPARAAGPVVDYTITDGGEIVDSLTGEPGDAGRGRALFLDGPRTGCPGCHGRPGEPGARTAADLAGIGDAMTPGALRLWLVAPAAIAPDTEMPAFYAAGQRDAADDPLYGGPALTAAEIEDLVTYLAGLKGRN